MPNDWSVSIPFGQDKVTSTTRHERKLGTIGYTPDGRKFRWAFSDGTIGAGQVVAAAVAATVHDRDLAVVSAAAVGDMTITLTVGAAAITANDYEDGYLFINDVDGEGHLYCVKSHPAISSGANGVFTLWEPVREALTTSSQAGIHKNEYKDCVVSPAANVNPTVGVAPTEIADNTYFWAQVYGMAAVLVEDTITAGQHVTASETNDAGACMAANYGGTAEWQNIGVAYAAVGADTEYGLIHLNI